MSIFSWWEAADQLLPDLFQPEERRHGCAEETSINLALHPHIVYMDRAVDEELRRHFAQADGVALPLDAVDGTSSGVFGESSAAAAEKGRNVFEAVVNELIKHVGLLKKAEIEDLMQKPKV